MYTWIKQSTTNICIDITRTTLRNRTEQIYYFRTYTKYIVTIQNIYTFVTFGICYTAIIGMLVLEIIIVYVIFYRKQQNTKYIKAICFVFIANFTILYCPCHTWIWNPSDHRPCSGHCLPSVVLIFTEDMSTTCTISCQEYSNHNKSHKHKHRYEKSTPHSSYVFPSKDHCVLLQRCRGVWWRHRTRGRGGANGTWVWCFGTWSAVDSIKRVASPDSWQSRRIDARFRRHLFESCRVDFYIRSKYSRWRAWRFLRSTSTAFRYLRCIASQSR